LACAVASLVLLCGVTTALTATTATQQRLRTDRRAIASEAEAALISVDAELDELDAEEDALTEGEEAEGEGEDEESEGLAEGEMESEEHLELTADELDAQSAAELSASTHQEQQQKQQSEDEHEGEGEGEADADRMTEAQLAAREARIAAKEAAVAEKEAKRKQAEQKRAADRAAAKAAADQKKADQSAKKQAEQQSKAEAKAKKKEEQKKKKEEIKKKKEEIKKKKQEERKKKQEERKKKREERKKKKEEERKKKKEEEHKRHHKLRKIKQQAHPHGSHHPPPDPYGHPDSDHHDGPSELASGKAEWRTAGTAFPPSHLSIKKYVLSVGTDNIPVSKVKGGHKGKPLSFKFAAGWETPVNGLIAKWQAQEKIDGYLYYIDRHGKSVAKLAFHNAQLQDFKWPKMTSNKKKADRAAKFKVTLQPETTHSEFFTKPEEADPAPELDPSKLMAVKKSGFVVKIDDFDDAKVDKLRLPSVRHRLKSATRFGYNKETKKQEKQKTFSVTAVRRKPFRLVISGKEDELNKWKTWKRARPPQPKQGTVELRNDNNAVYTIKFTNLYPNRVQKEKDRLAVDLTFDSMEVEKSGD